MIWLIVFRLVGLFFLIPFILAGMLKGAFNGSLIIIYYFFLDKSADEWDRFFLESEKGFFISIDNKIFSSPKKKLSLIKQTDKEGE